jgi:hypothetical protein
MAETPKRYQTPAEVLEDEIRELEKPLGRSWIPWTLGLAAIVVLLVIVGTVVNWQHGRVGSWLAQRQATVRLSAPVGEVAATPRSFEWHPVEGAAAYVVTVHDAAGDPVLTRRSHGTVLVPLDVEAALLAPGAYVWSVEAHDRDNRRIGRAEANFRIRQFQSVEAPVQ